MESEGRRYFNLKHLSGNGPSLIDLYEILLKEIFPYHLPDTKQQFYNTSSGFKPSKPFLSLWVITLSPNYGLTLKIPPIKSAGFNF